MPDYRVCRPPSRRMTASQRMPTTPRGSKPARISCSGGMARTWPICNWQPVSCIAPRSAATSRSCDSYIGLVRVSTYTRRQTPQEQAVFLQERGKYLIVYPFTKTAEWYLFSKATRQGMMNEHIKVGHEYAHIKQILVHSTGLDDQEFMVAYEAEDLAEFQSLVIDLRSTDGRAYTASDTPIYTCVHRPLQEALEILA